MTHHFPRLETDLKRIAALTQQKQNDYAAFRYYIELDEREDAELDKLVTEMAAPVVAAIDCTQCANCCRNLQVFLTPHDAARLAKGLGCSVAALEHDIIDRKQAVAYEEWGAIRQQPCPFLKGKLCSIYPHRPESCRLYPVFTPDFRWTLEDLFGGIGLCPIIYNVVERLKVVLKW
jgi:uncharacterized protein